MAIYKINQLNSYTHVHTSLSLSLMFIIIKCIEIIEIYRRCKHNYQIAIVVYSLEWKTKYKKKTQDHIIHLNIHCGIP